jgi:hypothetical protein
MFVLSFETSITAHTASHHRRLECSAAPLWEPQIQTGLLFHIGEVPGSNLGYKIGCTKFPQLLHRLVSFTLIIPQFDVPNPQQITSSLNKCKVRLRTGHGGPGKGQRYGSTLFLTSELDGVGCQRHAPAALPPGKTRHPMYRRLGGPQGPSGRVRKISPSPGFDPRTVQPLASRYSVCAIAARTSLNR